jgi:hypothetical protein
MLAAFATTKRSSPRSPPARGAGRGAVDCGLAGLTSPLAGDFDGDSFAPRSYHALPKTIRRGDGKAAGAILGFANFLLWLRTSASKAISPELP